MNTRELVCSYIISQQNSSEVTVVNDEILKIFSEEGSLGAYVISQCQQASDVLAVLLLQQDAGVSPLMRVVPLFETLDDLQRAPSTMDALFSMEPYTSKIGGHQEIMVGYSDSAKDAGSYSHFCFPYAL